MTERPRVAVVFDLDGTLLHLRVDIDAARRDLAALFAPWGITAPFRPVLARIREAAREAALRGAGDAADLARRGFAVLDAHEGVAARRAQACVGAADVVRELRARGVALGIVTDNGRACVAPALAAAGLSVAAFAVVVTRDDVPAPKPDPAGLVRALAQLGPRDVSWYVGDHPKDVAAARAVPALRVAGVAGGLGDPADADAQLRELREVLELAGVGSA